MRSSGSLITLTWEYGDAIIRCGGDLDPAAADRLRETAEGCLARSPGRLTVNLSAVSSFGAEGIDALAHLFDLAGSRQVPFEFVVAAPPVGRGTVRTPGRTTGRTAPHVLSSVPRGPASWR